MFLPRSLFIFEGLRKSCNSIEKRAFLIVFAKNYHEQIIKVYRSILTK